MKKWTICLAIICIFAVIAVSAPTVAKPSYHRAKGDVTIGDPAAGSRNYKFSVQQLDDAGNAKGNCRITYMQGGQVQRTDSLKITAMQLVDNYAWIGGFVVDSSAYPDIPEPVGIVFLVQDNPDGASYFMIQISACGQAALLDMVNRPPDNCWQASEGFVLIEE